MNLESFIGYAQAGLGQAIGVVEKKKAYKWTRKLMDAQYQHQVDFWNMNNAYNSPSAQMERFEAAGINPYMSLGNPNTSSYGSVMQAVPQYPEATPSVMQGIQMQLSAALQSAQIQNIQANTALTTEQTTTQQGITALQEFQSRNLRLDGDIKEVVRDYKRGVLEPSVQLAYAEYNYKVQQTANETVMFDLLGAKVAVTKAEKERIEATISKLKVDTRLSEAQIMLVLSRVNAQHIENTLRGAYVPYASNLAQSNVATAHHNSVAAQANADIASAHADVETASINSLISSKQFQAATAEEQYNLLLEFGYKQGWANVIGSYVGMGIQVGGAFLR